MSVLDTLEWYWWLAQGPNKKFADQNSLSDYKMSGRRWSSLQKVLDDKEGEKEGEQGWRLSRAWTVDLLVGASFVLQNRLKIDICHLLAWIVQSNPLSQRHQCGQKF